MNYLDEEKYLNGSSDHYNLFESLISGRNLESQPQPSDKFRKIFPAQIIKD